MVPSEEFPSQPEIEIITLKPCHSGTMFYIVKFPTLSVAGTAMAALTSNRRYHICPHI